MEQMVGATVWSRGKEDEWYGVEEGLWFKVGKQLWLEND